MTCVGCLLSSQSLVCPFITSARTLEGKLENGTNWKNMKLLIELFVMTKIPTYETNDIPIGPSAALAFMLIHKH